MKSIKEQFCYVAQNYEEVSTAAKYSSQFDKVYELPDDRQIAIPGQFRMQAPELMFKPTLDASTIKSIQTAAWHSISNTDIDVQRDLGMNTVLSGGNTMFAGIT